MCLNLTLKLGFLQYKKEWGGRRTDNKVRSQWRNERRNSKTRPRESTNEPMSGEASAQSSL